MAYWLYNKLFAHDLNTLNKIFETKPFLLMFLIHLQLHGRLLKQSIFMSHLKQHCWTTHVLSSLMDMHIYFLSKVILIVVNALWPQSCTDIMYKTDLYSSCREVPAQIVTVNEQENWWYFILYFTLTLHY